MYKETNMHLVPFYELFPEQAWAETRSITIRGHPILPDDDYGLIEAYCPDPKCDCRRVMLNVIGRQQGPDYLAAISYGFDRKKQDAGPFLDPLNPQSQYAPALLDLAVTEILIDTAYVARLESHYRQSKGARPQPRPSRPNASPRVLRGRPKLPRT
jgi:hypothetical protein